MDRSEPAAGEIRFDGLTMANVSSFTMSLDRRIVSALFDNFVLLRQPAAPGEQAEALGQERKMVFAVPPAARGRKVSAQVRGFWYGGGSDAAASVTLRLGASAHPAVLPAGEGEFHLDAQGETPAGEDSFVVEIEALVAPPVSTDGEIHLSVDSIDLGLID